MPTQLYTDVVIFHVTPAASHLPQCDFPGTIDWATVAFGGHLRTPWASSARCQTKRWLRPILGCLKPGINRDAVPITLRRGVLRGVYRPTRVGVPVRE